ncbi:MAG: hypothetical protein A2V70_16845 [Planctomycetes bacterium RBG_13_63_9]|nr:MAG: hypothetical protein A2V70_16845 [Planctomycetes bacterium RBG_13_63_9]
MEPQETDTSHTEQRQKTPFQYSLRSMFVLMTALAVGLSFLVAGPLWLSWLTVLLLLIAAPMVLTTVLIYGRGHIRTFCIGALFPAGVLLLPAGSIGILYIPMMLSQVGDPFDGDNPETKLWIGLAVLVGLVVIVAFGLLALGIRWLVEAPQRRRPQHASSPAEMEPADDATGQ